MATIKKLEMHARLSLGILGVGALLMTYMIVEEGELGALPLLLVVGSITSYCISRYRIRNQLN